MKIVKSQNKEIIINAKDIFHIIIDNAIDEDGDATGNLDIDVYFDVHPDSHSWTIASYSSMDDAIRNLDKLAKFLASDNSAGLYEMPKDSNDF